MRDFNQRLCPLSDCLPMQVRHSILRHYVAHEAARGDDARARAEHGNNSRNLSIFGGRGNRDDWFASLRARGSAQKVNLPADSTVELGAHGIGADLTGQVDLQGGGVTALAAKREYPVYVDETIELFDVVSISAGMRGLQILIAPADYLRATKGIIAALGQPKKQESR